MNTAIIINLDYQTQPIVKCRQLWKIIEVRMAKAGFIMNSRRFVTAKSAEAACTQARAVIDGIEMEYVAKGDSVLPFIRDFYAIPCDKIINLAAPVAHSIEVDLMASGAFQKFFS